MAMGPWLERWTSSWKRREYSALTALTLTFIVPDRRNLQCPRMGVGVGRRIWPTVAACGWCTVSVCCACGINVGQVKRYWQIGIDCNLRWDEWACGIESNGMEAQCLRGFADKWRDFKWLRAEQKVAGFCQLTFNYSSSTPPGGRMNGMGKWVKVELGQLKEPAPLGCLLF